MTYYQQLTTTLSDSKIWELAKDKQGNTDKDLHQQLVDAREALCDAAWAHYVHHERVVVESDTDIFAPFYRSGR